MMTRDQERYAKLLMRDQMRRYLVKLGYADASDFPKPGSYVAEPALIPQQAVIGAVVLMVIALGMGAGSSGDIDLYKLVLAYLQDPDARQQMNLVAQASKLT